MKPFPVALLWLALPVAVTEAADYAKVTPKLESVIREEMQEWGIGGVADGRHGWNRQNTSVFDLGTIPAGNLFTTAPDLARFASALLAGGEGFLKSASLAEMWRPAAAEGMAELPGELRAEVYPNHYYGAARASVCHDREHGGLPSNPSESQHLFVAAGDVCGRTSCIPHRQEWACPQYQFCQYDLTAAGLNFYATTSS